MGGWFWSWEIATTGFLVFWVFFKLLNFSPLGPSLWNCVAKLLCSSLYLSKENYPHHLPSYFKTLSSFSWDYYSKDTKLYIKFGFFFSYQNCISPLFKSWTFVDILSLSRRDSTGRAKWLAEQRDHLNTFHPKQVEKSCWDCQSCRSTWFWFPCSVFGI